MYSENQLLKVNELAKILKISDRTIYNGICRRAKRRFPIPVKRIGRSVRFDVRDVKKYIKSI